MRTLVYILCILAIISCNDEKEKSLELREQHLLEKEKAFATKEIEYEKLMALRDSLENETIAPVVEENFPEEILGSWSGKMICTETSCAEHVVGDQRTDSWEFTPDGLKMVNKTGGERLFTGKISGNELVLASDISSNTTNTSEIVLSLTDLQTGRLKGTRTLTGKNDCIARFSVELEKVKK